MASKNDDMNLDLGLDDLDLSFDPIKDTRKPIVKISSSFGKSLASELKTYRLIKDVTLASLPDTYKTAYRSIENVANLTRNVYKTAVKEFKPVVPDIKRSVQKILPTGKKYLPEKVANKLDSMSKPDEERESTPSQEEQQNREISGSIAEIFKTQMEYNAGEKAHETAYKHVRDQIQDDQFRMSHRTLATMGHGIQRMVAYQEQVTSNYQKKSLELQYRQFFATRELLRITALSAANTSKYLNSIMINTALPDFKKASWATDAETGIAKKLASSLFPNAQKFIDQYFANFTNGVSARVRENISGFINAYQGIKSVGEMTEGMDKHQLFGEMVGQHAAEFVGNRFGKTLKPRLMKSKAIQKLGNKLSYKLAGIPQRLNKFANGTNDYTFTHGFWVGNALNLLRDLTPRTGEGSNVIGKSTLLKANDPVPFSLAARQSLTEVIPGYLSRIHHELAIMRTGNPDVARLSWNPTRGQFTKAKATAKDIAKEVIRSGDIGEVTSKSNDFIKALDPDGELSSEAREYLKRRAITDALNGRGFDPETIMNDSNNLDPKTRTQVKTFFRKRFKLTKTGAETKRAKYDDLNSARVAHESLVNAVPGIKERAAALEDAGYGEALRGMGITSVDNEGQSVFNRDSMIDILLGKKRLPTYKDPYNTYETKLGNAVGLSGMLKAATGGVISEASLASLNKLGDKFEESDKSTDAIIQELREGALVSEERRQLEVLNKILNVLETKSFGGDSNIDKMIESGSATFAGLKDHIVSMTSNGWATVRNTAGKLRKVRLKEVPAHLKAATNTAQNKLQGTKAYHRMSEYLAKHPEINALVKNGQAQFANVKGKVIDITHDGAAYVMDKAGKIHYVDLNNFTQAGMAWIKDKTGQLHEVDIHALPENAKVWIKNQYGKLKQVNVKQAAQQAAQQATQTAQQAKTQTVSAYQKLINKLAQGAQKPGMRGHASATAGGVLGLLGGAASLGWKGARLGGHLTWGAAKLGFKALGLPLSVLGAVGRGLGHLTHGVMHRLCDVYVKGQKRPALYAKYMEEGRYLNVTDGKPIHSIKDIHGPVIDAETHDIVLTAEEYAQGLFDSNGVRIFKGISGGILGLMGWMTRMALVNPVKLAWEAVKLPLRALKAIKRFVTYDTDIYVGGEKTPRLLAAKMRQNAYICTTTKKPVHKASDIKGPVADAKTGNILIDKDDLDRGIYNALGHNLTRMIRGLWKVAQIPLKVAKFAWDTGRAIASGGFALLSGGVKGLANRLAGHDIHGKGPVKIMASQLDVQHAIFRLLHERLPKLKRKPRANSWESKFLKTKAAEAKAKLGGMKAIKAKGKGALAGLGGFLSKLFHHKKKDDDDDSSGGLLDKLKDLKHLKNAKKMFNILKRGKLRGASRLLGRSKLGRGLRFMGRGVRGAGRFLGKGLGMAGEAGEGAEALGGAATAGEAVAGAGEAAAAAGGVTEAAGIAGIASGIGEGLLAVGGAALSVLSSPVVLIGGGLALLGIGAYLAWKWYKGSGPKDLINVRLAQYGIDKSNSREVEKVLKLEAELEKHVKFQGTQANIDFNGVNVKDILENFGVNIKHPKEVKVFANWFHLRFEPVYLNFMDAVKKVAPNVKLGDADKSLKASQKLEVLKQMKKLDRQVYQVKWNPFFGQHKFWIFGKVGNIQSGTYYVDMAFKEAEEKLGKEAAKEKKEKPHEGPKGAKAGKAAAAAGATAASVKAIGDKSKPKKEPASGIGAKGAAAAAAASSAKIAGGNTKLVSNVITFKPLNNNLTPLQSLRFRQYGLIELTHDKVTVLYALERATLAKVKIDAKGVATFTGDAGDFFKEYCTQFGSINTDKNAKKTWTDWYLARFVPTVIQFASAVYSVNPHVKPENAEDYLKPTDLLAIGKNILGAKAGATYSHVSVWAISASPWANYKVNTDIHSTDFCIENLKSAVANQVYQEKNAPQNKPDQNNAATANKSKTTPPPTGSKPSTKTQLKLAVDNTKSTFTSPSDNSSAVKSYVKAAGYDDFSGSDSSTGSPVSPITGGTGGSLASIPMPGAGRGWNAAKATICAAAAIAGVDPALCGTIANIESSFNPKARAGTSSATGYFQFVRGTWNRMMSKYASKYGIPPNTPPTDPRANALMGALFTRDNQKALERSLGGKVTDTDVYLAHFLGVGGAEKLLKANPSANAAAVFPQAASANPNIFNGRSVSGVISLMSKKVASHAVDGLPVGNGMMSSKSKLANEQVSPVKHKYGMASTGSAQPATGKAAGGISAFAGNPNPMTPSVPFRTAKTFAATPTPNISQPMSSQGGMYYASDDSTVENNSRRNVMQRAAANDDVMRRTNDNENARSSKVADLLAQSLEVQTSMDSTLKAILTAVMNQNGNAAPSKTGSGTTSTASSQGTSQPLSQSPIDLQRYYG